MDEHSGESKEVTDAGIGESGTEKLVPYLVFFSFFHFCAVRSTNLAISSAFERM